MRISSDRLFKQLQEYGLDYLIPDYISTDDDDSEGVGHTHNEYGMEYIDSTDTKPDSLRDFIIEWSAKKKFTIKCLI